MADCFVQRVIIPKGLVNPNETTIVEIPGAYKNARAVVAKVKTDQMKSGGRGVRNLSQYSYGSSSCACSPSSPSRKSKKRSYMRKTHPEPGERVGQFDISDFSIGGLTWAGQRNESVAEESSHGFHPYVPKEPFSPEVTYGHFMPHAQSTMGDLSYEEGSLYRDFRPKTTGTPTTRAKSPGHSPPSMDRYQSGPQSRICRRNTCSSGESYGEVGTGSSVGYSISSGEGYCPAGFSGTGYIMDGREVTGNDSSGSYVGYSISSDGGSCPVGISSERYGEDVRKIAGSDSSGAYIGYSISSGGGSCSPGCSGGNYIKHSGNESNIGGRVVTNRTDVGHYPGRIPGGKYINKEVTEVSGNESNIRGHVVTNRTDGGHCPGGIPGGNYIKKHVKEISGDDSNIGGRVVINRTDVVGHYPGGIPGGKYINKEVTDISGNDSNIRGHVVINKTDGGHCPGGIPGGNYINKQVTEISGNESNVGGRVVISSDGGSCPVGISGGTHRKDVIQTIGTGSSGGSAGYSISGGGSCPVGISGGTHRKDVIQTIGTGSSGGSAGYSITSSGGSCPAGVCGGTSSEHRMGYSFENTSSVGGNVTQADLMNSLGQIETSEMQKIMGDLNCYQSARRKLVFDASSLASAADVSSSILTSSGVCSQ